MKRINLRGISEILSSKELKNVMGGSMPISNYPPRCGSGNKPTGSFCERAVECQSCQCVRTEIRQPCLFGGVDNIRWETRCA